MLRILFAPAERRRSDQKYLKGQTPAPCHCNTIVKSPIQGGSEFPLMYCIEDNCHRLYVAIPLEYWRRVVRDLWDRHKQLYIPQLVDLAKNVLPFKRR